MSIIKRNGDGKIRLDWNSFITWTLTLIISGTITGFGSYYAIKYDIRQQDYRLTIQEHKTDTLELAVNNMRMKDAGDSVAFLNVCNSLDEIKGQLKEIRNDQIRRARRE